MKILKMWKALVVGSLLQYGIYMPMLHDGNILQLALVQTFYDAEFVFYYAEMWPWPEERLVKPALLCCSGIQEGE